MHSRGITLLLLEIFGLKFNDSEENTQVCLTIIYVSQNLDTCVISSPSSMKCNFQFWGHILRHESDCRFQSSNVFLVSSHQVFNLNFKSTTNKAKEKTEPRVQNPQPVCWHYPNRQFETWCNSRTNGMNSLVSLTFFPFQVYSFSRSAIGSPDIVGDMPAASIVCLWLISNNFSFWSSFLPTLSFWSHIPAVLSRSLRNIPHNRLKKLFTSEKRKQI